MAMKVVTVGPYLEPTDPQRQAIEEWCRKNLEKGSWISGYQPVDANNNIATFYYAFFRKQDEIMFRMVWT